MLENIARQAIASPRRIIVIVMLIMVGAAIFGVPVVKSLPAAGFRDPTSQSWHASQVLADKFGHGDMQMVISVQSPDGGQSASARAAGAGLATWLQSFPFTTRVESAWTAPPELASALVSKDGKTGLVVAGITGGESGAQ